MALIQCDFFSDVLGVSTSMNVILPQDTKKLISMKGSVKRDKYPTLYLLHGLTGDDSTWVRKTSIERYVSAMGLAVVMPNGGRSFYTDMKNGYNYFTFITEELPEIARSFFPLSDKREENFIAGLSMGGYGAFKAALSCPEKYSAAASMSGILDIVSMASSREVASMKKEAITIFGDFNEVPGSKNDLLHLVKRAADSDKTPKLYQCCGTEDFLYSNNLGFKDFAAKSGLDITYEEEAGSHEWGYWDKKIQRVLEWLPIK